MVPAAGFAPTSWSPSLKVTCSRCCAKPVCKTFSLALKIGRGARCCPWTFGSQNRRAKLLYHAPKIVGGPDRCCPGWMMLAKHPCLLIHYWPIKSTINYLSICIYRGILKLFAAFLTILWNISFNIALALLYKVFLWKLIAILSFCLFPTMFSIECILFFK